MTHDCEICGVGIVSGCAVIPAGSAMTANSLCLLVMTLYCWDYNNNRRFVLVCIDCLEKRLAASIENQSDMWES